MTDRKGSSRRRSNPDSPYMALRKLRKRLKRNMADAGETCPDELAILAATAGSGTVDALLGMEAEFNRAYRKVWDEVYKAKQGLCGLAKPVTRNFDLAGAVLDLWTAVESNAVFGDPAAGRARDKFAALHRLAMDYRYKSGDELGENHSGGG